MNQSPAFSLGLKSLSTRQRAGTWMLVAAVLASALILGALFTWTLCLVTAVLAASTFLLWFGAEPSRARPVAGLLVAVAASLTVFTALQALPIPVSFLAVVSPQSADVWARALKPLQEPGPSWATLSIDPIATRIQVLRGVAYLLAFLSALRIAQRREGSAFLQNVLVASGIVLAVAALVHPFFGVQKVLWIYQPSSGVEVRHVAPLLNSNHLASYVNIAACVAFGGAIAPKSPFSRPILFALFLLLLGVELWIGSRGGMLGTVLGIGVAVALSRAATRGPSIRSTTMVVGAVFVAAAGMIVLSLSSEAMNELATADVSKVAIAWNGFGLARLFPWFGAGRGTFEVAFPAVRTLAGEFISFTHPENILVQWTTEWGIPAAVAAFACIGFALRPASVMARSQPPVGAWAAIVAVGVHDLVDFSLEVPGVMIPIVVCAAIVTGGTGAGGAASLATSWSTRPLGVALAGPVLAVVAILLVIPGASHELGAERVALRDHAVDPSLAREAFHTVARGALLRHPAEPYLPFLGGVRAARAKDESVIPWIARTLERAPVYGPAHLVLAQSLYGRSPSQARLEYRTALEQDLTTGGAFRAGAPGLVASYFDAMELVPTVEPAHSVALRHLIDSLGQRLPATSVRLDEELARVSIGDRLDPLRRAAQAALADIQQGEAAPWCVQDRAACFARGLAAAAALRDQRPEMCEGFEAHAKLLMLDGQTKAALDELDEASAHVQDWSACLHALIDAARAAHDDARITQSLDRLTRAGCVTDEECVRNFNFAANTELSRGNPRRALSLYKMAYERVPSDELLASQADLAARVGLHAEALEGFTKLAQHNPSDARWPPRIAAERDAVSRRGL